MSCGLSVFECFLETSVRVHCDLWAVTGRGSVWDCGTLYVFTRPRQFCFLLSMCPPQAACALCEMLSGTVCREAIQELYPRLLLAVLCHLFWVIEQNAPQKMVVYRKDGGSGKPFDPTR